MALVSANDAEFYYELRGSGPALLLMMGATGDGGVFDRFADLLADEFTVIIYDRRGNGRSPRPAGWDTTSPEEQADDAAALLDVLGLAPAAIFGTSSGGVFALEMVIRHPLSVLGAVLHEPGLVVLFDDPAQVRGIVTAAVEEGMRLGGRRLALERFVRLVAGDANWNRLDPSLRARMLSSSDTYFDIEIGKFDTYLPDASTLARIDTPSSWSSATEACPTSPKQQRGSQPVSASTSHQHREPTSPTSITPKSSPIRSSRSFAASAAEPSCYSPGHNRSLCGIAQHSPQDNGRRFALIVPSGHRARVTRRVHPAMPGNGGAQPRTRRG